jgi:hypothetical protein
MPTGDHNPGTGAVVATVGQWPVREIITSAELAERLCLPESWIRDQVGSRSPDPIPHLRFGRYVRFAWGDPALLDWLTPAQPGPLVRRNRPTRQVAVVQSQ